MEIDHKNEIKIRKTNHTKEKLTIKSSTYNICKLLIIFLSILSIIFLILIIILLIKIFKSTKCENGYFHPENEKTLCYKCEIKNCEKCSGTIENQICNFCKEKIMEDVYHQMKLIKQEQ